MSAIAMSLICAWAIAWLIGPHDPLRWQVLRWVGILGVVILGAGVARADNREALSLARICVGEAGWERGPDCPAIHAVLEHRAAVRGDSWMGAARAYSPGHLGLREAHRRPWIPWLRPGGRQPWHWPRALRWERYRPRWLSLLDYAREIVAGEVDHGCSAEPHYWGMRSGIDMRRARAAGWRMLDCGQDGQQTRNAFWAVR